MQQQKEIHQPIQQEQEEIQLEQEFKVLEELLEEFGNSQSLQKKQEEKQKFQQLIKTLKKYQQEIPILYKETKELNTLYKETKELNKKPQLTNITLSQLHKRLELLLKKQGSQKFNTQEILFTKEESKTLSELLKYQLNKHQEPSQQLIKTLSQQAKDGKRLIIKLRQYNIEKIQTLIKKRIKKFVR